MKDFRNLFFSFNQLIYKNVNLHLTVQIVCHDKAVTFTWVEKIV